MKEELFIEITNRLYKSLAKGIIGNYNVKGNGYNFKINISESGYINLIHSDNYFNEINKICNAIPYLIYLRQHKIKMK